MCFGKKPKIDKTEKAIPPARPVRMQFKEIDYSSSDSSSSTSASSSSSASSIIEKNRNPSLVSSAYLRPQPSPCSSARNSFEIPDYPSRRGTTLTTASTLTNNSQGPDMECIDGVDPEKVMEKLAATASLGHIDQHGRRNTMVNINGGLLRPNTPNHVRIARARPRSSVAVSHSAASSGVDLGGLKTKIVNTDGFEGRIAATA